MDFLRRLSAVLLCVTASVALAADGVWLLGADDWARPREGASMVQMPPLAEVVEAWGQQPGQRLIVRYPGGEEGLLWANELRSWLVALGMPSKNLELVAGSRQPDQIELELKR